MNVTPEELKPGLSLPAGQSHTLVLKRRQAIFVELDDLNFHTASAVLLPAPHTTRDWREGHIGGLSCIIRALEHVLEKNHTLLIAGHTDTAGGDSANRELSKARAENVRLFLTGDSEGWAAACGKHKVNDYQSILTWVANEYGWNCDPHGVDGQHGPRTTAALKGFRRNYQASYGRKLPSAERMTMDDWKALFHLYDVYVARSVDLEKARNSLQLAAPPILACGEDWPIEGQGKDNFRSQSNRRVELIFFKEPPTDFSTQDPPGAQLFGTRLFYQRRFLSIAPRHRFFFSI